MLYARLIVGHIFRVHFIVFVIFQLYSTTWIIRFKIFNSLFQPLIAELVCRYSCTRVV